MQQLKGTVSRDFRPSGVFSSINPSFRGLGIIRYKIYSICRMLLLLIKTILLHCLHRLIYQLDIQLNVNTAKGG
jgi:hypothetical protein